MKRMILGSILAAGVLAGFGCEASFQPAPILVGGEVDIGPDAVYYDRGGYVGDYWVWHDQQGREMREARSVHENRAARTHAQARPEAKSQAKPEAKAQAKPQAERHEEHQESHEEHK